MLHIWSNTRKICMIKSPPLYQTLPPIQILLLYINRKLFTKKKANNLQVLLILISFFGISMVINPDFIRQLYYSILGINHPHSTNNPLSPSYFIGILFALTVPFFGPIIGLIWKKYPEIDPFRNLLIWSVFMLVGSTCSVIFFDI